MNMTIDQYILKQRIEELERERAEHLEYLISLVGDDAITHKEWPDILISHRHDIALLELTKLYNIHYKDTRIRDLQARLENTVKRGEEALLQDLHYIPSVKERKGRADRTRDICGND